MIKLKDYISWSQYSLFNKSKKEYYKRYSLGQESKSNRFFRKGNELGEYLETGILPENNTDPLLETVGSMVPKLDIMEDKIEVEFEGHKLLMFSDSGSLDGSEFYEYKSGKVPWTQNLVDTHEQLDFYATCYYIKNGTIPSCKLVWIETEEEDSEDGDWKVLRYTGKVEIFERKFILSDIVEMQKKLIKTIKEIEEFEYVEIEVEEYKMDRYIEIQNTIKLLTVEASKIKEEVFIEMHADEVNYASSSNGRFSMSSRKNWNYSKELTDKIARYKAETVGEQKIEQKKDIATFTITKSLRFSLIEN